MKKFFSILFLFVFFSDLSLAQDAYDKARVQTTPVVTPITGDPQYEAPVAVLYNNGPLVNAPGGGFGGADASVLQTAIGLTVYGYGHQITSNNSIADDFTVGGNSWQVDQMQFFAYQTNSTSSSSITDVRVQIWNGDPAGGGTVIWGDLSTNRLATTSFSNIYRSIDTAPLASTRPIMVQTVTIGTTLVPGTYWVQWMTGGTLTSGPWAPPITINGQTSTGNGKQNFAGTWLNVMDSTFQQGFPFIVLGTAIPNIAAPVLVFPANDSTEISTNPELVWQIATGADTYTLQRSIISDFSRYAVFTGITGTSFSIYDLAENTKYYWRVRGESGATAGSWSEVWNFTTKSTINFNYTINFPTRDYAKDYKDTDYKILGLPGNGNINVGSLFTGTQGTDWQAYWDNGNPSTPYYDKYDGTSKFYFTKGKAFWIIKKGDLNINSTVNAASLDTVGIVEIPLNNGWTLITNPFIIPVQWSDVLNLNELVSNTPLNTFNNGWSLSSVLQPSVGYLFNNSTGLNTLKVGYPIGGGDKPLPKQTDQFVWNVRINLICDELIDHTTSFGVSKEALEGKDKFDHKKPRGIGNIPIVYFSHPDWDDEYEFFATDFCPEFEDEQTWDVKVFSELREPVTLKFSGMEGIPGDWEIYLVDKDRAKYVDLRLEDEYEFTAVKTISDFQIIVGELEFINSKLNELLPTEFELENNFPNPFNPTTTIPVSIPQTANIKLVIYNILGQEVKVLFDGEIQSGKYWYLWDGKNSIGETVPSGIYLYNFVSNTGVNISKKMILIK